MGFAWLCASVLLVAYGEKRGVRAASPRSSKFFCFAARETRRSLQYNHTAPMSFGKKKNIASSGWEVQRFLLLLKGLNELDIKSRLDLV